MTVAYLNLHDGEAIVPNRLPLSPVGDMKDIIKVGINGWGRIGQ